MTEDPATDFFNERERLFRVNAAGYSRVAVANIAREFPSDIHHTMTEPGDFPFRPRERTPVFFGSFDWHSCVEMHWLLVRLLRTAAGTIPAQHVRRVLDRQFAPSALAAEATFMARTDDAFRQRPYGWGWALALIEETARLGDADGRRWAAAMAPLGDTLTDCFLRWLPKATYPIRHGLHSNSAFGLSRALPYARRAAAGDPRLADAILAAARRWFAADAGYPASWSTTRARSGRRAAAMAATNWRPRRAVPPPGPPARRW